MFHLQQPNNSPQSPPVRRADAGKIPAPAPNGQLAPAAGPIALTFHPWTAADVMPLIPAELPAPGHLTIRDIRISTLMGRTVRYLIPAFTATA
jgi:hypothetical protein